MKQKIEMSYDVTSSGKKFYIDSVYLLKSDESNPKLFAIGRVVDDGVYDEQVIMHKKDAVEVETKHGGVLPVETTIVDNEAELTELKEKYKNELSLSMTRDVTISQILCGVIAELKIAAIYQLKDSLVAIGRITFTRQADNPTQMRILKDTVKGLEVDPKLPLQTIVEDNDFDLALRCDEYGAKAEKCLYFRDPSLSYDNQKDKITLFAAKAAANNVALHQKQQNNPEAENSSARFNQS